MARGAARQLVLFEQHRVRPSRLREVIENARAGDPAPYHDRSRAFHCAEIYSGSDAGETVPGFPYAGPLNGASRLLARRKVISAGFAALTPSGKVKISEFPPPGTSAVPSGNAGGGRD